MTKNIFNIQRVLFLLVFLLPVTCINLYSFFVTQERFESVASIYITEESSQNSPFDLSLLGITNAGSVRDILVLKSFIQSPEMLTLLDQKLDMREHFTNANIDIFSRLKSDASKEEFLEYYLKRVFVDYDDQARLLQLSAQAYDRSFSQRILSEVFKNSQKFIDKLNVAVSDSQLRFFETEVKRSEQELRKEKTNLRTLQKKYKIISTQAATKTIVTTIAKLEQTLAKSQAFLVSRKRVLSNSAPAIRRLKSDIKGLQIQIKVENGRLTSRSGGAMSEINAQFQETKLLIEYKTLRFKANLDALKKAKAEAVRRLRFLTVVSAPTLADEALYPNRSYIFIVSLLCAMFVYFVTSIMVAIIKEQS